MSDRITQIACMPEGPHTAAALYVLTDDGVLWGISDSRIGYGKWERIALPDPTAVSPHQGTPE